MKRTIEELKQLEIRVKDSDSKISFLEKQIETLNETNRRLREQVMQKDDEILGIKRERETLAARLRDLEFNIDDLNRSNKDKERNLGLLEQDNERQRKELREFSETRERLNKTEREKDSLNQGIKLVNDLLSQERSNNEDLNRKYRKLEQEITERFRTEY